MHKTSKHRVGENDTTIDTLSPSMYITFEQEIAPDGSVVVDSKKTVNHVYLNGVRIAAVTPGTTAVYYLTDQVDSVNVVLNDSGMILSQTEFLPFGETWTHDGDTKHAPKYNSQELDKESGYYFYNARHYDPEIARFVTPDTVIDGELSTQGWDRFAYVHNNPIRYKDPTGHSVSGSWNTGGASGSWASASEKISNAFSSAVSSVENFFSGNNQNEYSIIFTNNFTDEYWLSKNK